MGGHIFFSARLHDIAIWISVGRGQVTLGEDGVYESGH